MDKTLTKTQLIEQISEQMKISYASAETYVNQVFSSLINTLSEGDRVEIRGFGVFKVRHHEGYLGRNPKTGDSIQVPEKKRPFFKASKELCKQLNNED